ncbi:type IV pilin protein [Aeromonas caviae]|uniref:type IV pilin protein n=1 Tax=Aeromonas caviae TaxID=648 RepID=UPI00244BB503|nr:type IV pilin protein [Aeromonas caviae]MDH1221769.1 type IV pilin protein [Aeromonas caviae]MDT8955292.1 type IV pilin protein [Aeromonas caviae]
MTGKARCSKSKMRSLRQDVCQSSMAARGFTLIELLIVVVVVAVLAAIAVPSYRYFILQSHRADAKTALATLQLAQEKYRGNNLTYATTLTALGLTAASPQGYYTIAIQSASSSGYAANATVAGQQTADTTCQKLAVTQAGFSTDSTKTSNPSDCWGL